MPGCNEKNCTCPWVTCVRHGKCCECVMHHREPMVGHVPNCMAYLVENAVQDAMKKCAEPDTEASAEPKE